MQRNGNMQISKGYWVIQCQEIRNLSAMQKYAEAWPEIADEFGATLMAGSRQAQAVEGGAISRLLIVEFPSYQAALDCYHSEKYQRAKEFAEQAMERTLAIVEGV